MKTATLSKAISLLALLAYNAFGAGQTNYVVTKFSSFPAASVVTTNDECLVNQWNGTGYTTVRANVQLLTNGLPAVLNKQLLLPAGSVTAGSSPLYFTAQNVLQTVPEPGSMFCYTNENLPSRSLYFTAQNGCNYAVVLTPTNGLCVKSNGWVGINTTNPTSMLNVSQGAINAASSFLGNSGTPSLCTLQIGVASYGLIKTNNSLGLVGNGMHVASFGNDINNQNPGVYCGNLYATNAVITNVTANTINATSGVINSLAVNTLTAAALNISGLIVTNATNGTETLNGITNSPPVKLSQLPANMLATGLNVTDTNGALANVQFKLGWIQAVSLSGQDMSGDFRMIQNLGQTNTGAGQFVPQGIVFGTGIPTEAGLPATRGTVYINAGTSNGTNILWFVSQSNGTNKWYLIK